MSYDAVPDSKPVGAAENVTDGENEDAVATLVEKPKCCCPCWNRTRFLGGNRRAYVTVLVLFLINLLNYMDRQTIPGKNTMTINAVLSGRKFTEWPFSSLTPPPLIMIISSTSRRPYCLVNARQKGLEKNCKEPCHLYDFLSNLYKTKHLKTN